MTKEEIIEELEKQKQELLIELAQVNGTHDHLLKDIFFINSLLSEADKNDSM